MVRTTGLALQRAPDRGMASRPVGETREGALHRATESSCRESPFVKKPESNDSGSGADNRTCKDERSKDGIAERCDASRIRTVMMWDKRGNEPKKQKNKRRCNSLVFLAQKASFPKVVRTTGLEPAQPFDHKNLNLTRLPIPPCPHESDTILSQKNKKANFFGALFPKFRRRRGKTVRRG